MTSKLDGCLFSVLLQEPNYWLRTVPPECTEEYAMDHDRNVLQCLCSILQVEELPSHFHEVTSLPLTLGGVWR